VAPQALHRIRGPAWARLSHARGGHALRAPGRRRRARLHRDPAHAPIRRRWSTASSKITRSRIEYRGVSIEGDGRGGDHRAPPESSSVDEDSRHTNAHRTAATAWRFQDVLEILDKAISVIGAFNIPAPREPQRRRRARDPRQDARRRARQLPARGRSIVNLDLDVEDLLERLKVGKIYGQEKISPGALGELLHQREAGHPARAGAALRVAVEHWTGPAGPTGAGSNAGARDEGGNRGPRRRHPAAKSAPVRRPRGARARPCHCVHVVVPAARGGVAPARLAPGRQAQHRLVRGLRRDARTRRPT